MLIRDVPEMIHDSLRDPAPFSKVGALRRGEHELTLRFKTPEMPMSETPLVVHLVADGVIGMDMEERSSLGALRSGAAAES